MTKMTRFLPDVNGLSVPRAALAYVDAGIPIVPFDPARGNGKECGNLVGGGSSPWHKLVTTDKAQLHAWKRKFGGFQALATSPGEASCVVIDLDSPEHWPNHWRKYLKDRSVPFVNTRPNQHKRRGHYWFTCPTPVPNRSYIWGELRSVGGGIVLPPYAGRTVVRAGVPPALPGELHTAFVAGAVGVGQLVDLHAFLDRHVTESKAYKLKGIAGIYRRELRYSRHNAARTALTVGFGEARLGYVAARNVYDVIRSRWTKSNREFEKLAQWCATVADESDAEVLKAKSDRTAGTDSRTYAAYFAQQPE
jgi:hypothetical protein